MQTLNLPNCHKHNDILELNCYTNNYRYCNGKCYTFLVLLLKI